VPASARIARQGSGGVFGLLMHLIIHVNTARVTVRVAGGIACHDLPDYCFNARVVVPVCIPQASSRRVRIWSWRSSRISSSILALHSKAAVLVTYAVIVTSSRGRAVVSIICSHLFRFNPERISVGHYIFVDPSTFHVCHHPAMMRTYHG
jgi:hypothetical protein